jgi:hypothetical protein
LNINIKINSHNYTTIMHIENSKLKYNQTIVTERATSTLL